MTAKKLLKDGLILGAMTMVVVLFLMIIGYVGRAHADTGISPDDPLSALGQLYAFIRTGKGTAALGVTLVLVVWALRNIPIPAYKTWAQTPLGGYVLVYGTSLLTYLGTGLGSGNPFTAMMLLNAAGAALVASGGWEHLRDVVTSLWDKKPPQAPPGAAAVLAIFVALAAGGVACDSGCKGVQSAETAVVDCTKASTSKLDALLTEFYPLLQGGSPDWPAVEAKAEAAGVEIGGCALAMLVQDYLSNTKKLPTVDQGWTARGALEHFRGKFAGNATFHTAKGDL